MSLILRNLSFLTEKRIATPLCKWHKPLFRTYVSRKDCAVYEGPRCSKELLEKQPPCAMKQKRIESDTKPPNPNTMWENPECCLDTCPEYMPRFDELYYKSSDKLKRHYQQTWVACPEQQKKPKVVRQFDHLKMPPLEKRPREVRPQTACPQGGARLCMESKGKNCPRVKMHGCQGVRYPPKCKSERVPSTCKKDCAPYPSYSECMRDAVEPLPPEECKCLDHKMMCEAWAEMRRRMTFVK